MSWSIYQSGKVAAVKKKLDEQFANQRRWCALEHELGTLALVEQLIAWELDYLDPATPVSVAASGSAYENAAANPARGSNFQVKLDPLYDFVE